MNNKPRTSRDISKLLVLAKGRGFIVEIVYKDSKSAIYSVDGPADLGIVFDTILRQMAEGPLVGVSKLN